MREQATDTPCPAPNPFVYPPPLNPATSTPRGCEGTPDRNGFYGDGIVNAAAVGADAALDRTDSDDAVPRGRRETGALALLRAGDDVAVAAAPDSRRWAAAGVAAVLLVFVVDRLTSANVALVDAVGRRAADRRRSAASPRATAAVAVLAIALALRRAARSPARSGSRTASGC